VLIALFAQTTPPTAIAALAAFAGLIALIALFAPGRELPSHAAPRSLHLRIAIETFF
jgi:hypothetical protein